ncbi:MAG: hypothetical protein ACRDY6_14380, partial [Acidimicrobiia bacterium]
LQETGLDDGALADEFPAVSELGDDWVGIINDMTPMIGAMSDNVDNYDAVAALPPFRLFPWFFVGPGVLVALLALLGGRDRARRTADRMTAPERRPTSEAERSTAMSHRVSRVVPALVALALVAAACGDDNGDGNAADTEVTGGAEELIGTFELDPGACDASGITGGSYLQMVFPGGTIENGPFFENPDSECDDKTFTIVSPGVEGGLVTDDYQPVPDPAFDSSGNSLADAILEPQAFTAIGFSVSSNPTDPQTGEDVPAPEIVLQDSELSGDVSAVAASWNNEYFNQGSPKPDGSTPGLTTPVNGTYDPETGRFVLEWSSQIVGGPFNDFTGIWHLEGTFRPAAG